MASLPTPRGDRIRCLDPGAGVGTLTAAWVKEICSRSQHPKEVILTAFEIDRALLPVLQQTLEACERTCSESDIACKWEIRADDFIEWAVRVLDSGLFSTECLTFDLAILNPPYKKIRSDSRIRQLLRRVNIETSNLYTAFLALVVKLLDNKGELVAITPRSFCNGPYFRQFRRHLLSNVSLKRVHIYESRCDAFRDDDVLQENVVLYAVKGIHRERTVQISRSRTPEDKNIVERTVPLRSVVRPGDPQMFIHLVPDKKGQALADAMEKLPCMLDDLGLAVSTGRIVDFRARRWLRLQPSSETVPLIYPTHFDGGIVRWPKLMNKKANAIVYNSSTATLMVSSGIYVLVKRFSAKEERRRVVAAVFDNRIADCEAVGFENHLNYFHERGAPLNRTLAWGLAAFLNCSLLDTYFRQFNGHTQVNATDLRALRYPTKATLVKIGSRVHGNLPSQEMLDAIIVETLGLD
ncbi:MAG: Eco57I restriction-modification methylase domain-containing protein [candidate division Zixibacteria bacterium]|nr:Eco57I restriction-modification methylase domain-containing protein [candidate division Zixibacteria bacterium]